MKELLMSNEVNLICFVRLHNIWKKDESYSKKLQGNNLLIPTTAI